MSPRSRKPHWAAYVPVSPRRPAVRRSAVALLVASALTGGYALAAGPITAQLGTVARECDAPQAMRQLAAARQTRTDTRALLADLRTTGAADPRAAALSEEISGLGFTPARYSGWRQKAVDVSDQLHGTTDPGLRKIAVELARHGVGPTPADLLDHEPPPEPGPIADMGKSLGQAADDTLGGAVDAAGQAAKNAAPKPAATGGQGRSEPKTKKQQAEPPLPQTCLDNTASAATNPAAPAVAGTAAPAAPQAAPAPAAPQADPPDEQTAVPLPSYSAEPDPDEDTAGDSSSQDGSDGDGSGETADATSPNGDASTSGDSSADSTGSGDTDSSSSTGGSGSGSSGDIADAREAIQLLGQLMQALGATGDIDAADLAEKLQQAIPAGTGGQDEPETSQGDKPKPTSSTDDSGSTDESGSAGSGDSSSSGDSTSDSGGAGDSSNADGEGTTDEASGAGEAGSGTAAGWQPQAEKLAEQVSEAASSDPLAQELADKLDAAGIDAGSGNEDSGDTSTDDGADESGQSNNQPAGDTSTDDPSPAQNDDTEQNDGSPGNDTSGDSDNGQGGDDQPGGEQPGGDESPSQGGDTSGDESNDESGDPAPANGDTPADEGAGDSGSTEDKPAEDKPAEEQTGPDESGEQPRDPEAGGAEPAASGGDVSADTATWDKLAACESSGDWSTDSGNGYKGGLQFDPATWEAFGGQGDPAQASKDEQIAVAEKVQAEQGWNAWPACSEKLGLS
ncbi:transglycosylase family protein [Pseudonocardia sp. KRD291]|uniref:transglycosylase family protein n=1 Tax=Pseudonocardia sp. KRD291 TaxID=2792007 RepID=UPI0021079165|nr:transglycosylase family protein [Pseudonocardia sp. KRD291]